jgi:DNA invertase Pin-like site-specific DNA recombinase
MKTIGYIRVSSDKQDLEKQEHLLFQYAHRHRLTIDRFIGGEVSAMGSLKERKLDVLMGLLVPGDMLLVAELSRLGRNMLETLNIIHALTAKNIKIVFVRQPELSTDAGHAKLLLAIYGYLAETEREYIAMRTRQGLAAAKAQGKILGRPKGSRNKKGRALDGYKEQIGDFLRTGASLSAVRKIINHKMGRPLSYSTYKFYVTNDRQLLRYWKEPDG